MGTKANQMPSGTPAARRQLTVRADAAARAQRGWAARTVGATWSEVAEIAGYSSAAVACRAVSRYFGRLPVLDADQTRDLWRARLEHLWRQSVRDVAEQRSGAIRSAVSVAQRAAALDGLDQPNRIELSTPGAAEFNELVRAMVEHQMGEALEADVFSDDPEPEDAVIVLGLES